MELGWVDFSSEDRRKLQRILSWFDERRTIDRLGFGVLRDTISDKLFPATSTLHTRARYLFLIAYDLRDLERKAASSKSRMSRDLLRKKYRDKEIKRKRELMALYNNHEGIHGNSLSGNRWLSQQPIDMYWSSIRELGLYDATVCGGASQARYFAYLSNKSAGDHSGFGSSKTERRELQDDGATEQLRQASTLCWKKLPAHEPKGWGFSLTKEEAQLLQSAYQEKWPNSLLTYLLEQKSGGHFLKAFLGRANISALSETAQRLKSYPPQHIKDDLMMANSFLHFSHCCNTRFNFLLAKAANTNTSEAQKRWNQIVRNDIKEAIRYSAEEYYDYFNIQRLSGGSPAALLFAFCNKALPALQSLAVAPRSRKALEALDDAIKEQERLKKKGLALLHRLESGELTDVTDMTSEDPSFYDFRLKQGRMMVTDIRNGLGI